jgi:hypothetical protein
MRRPFVKDRWRGRRASTPGTVRVTFWSDRECSCTCTQREPCIVRRKRFCWNCHKRILSAAEKQKREKKRLKERALDAKWRAEERSRTLCRSTRDGLICTCDIGIEGAIVRPLRGSRTGGHILQCRKCDGRRVPRSTFFALMHVVRARAKGATP